MADLEDLNVADSGVVHQLADAGEERHVRAGVERQPDGVDVLLHQCAVGCDPYDTQQGIEHIP